MNAEKHTTGAPDAPSGYREYEPGDCIDAMGGIDAMLRRQPPHASGGESPAAPAVPVFQSLDTVTPERVDWIIRDWLPQGHLTLLAGRPGKGKTTLALKVAALVSTGGSWGDGSAVGAGRVLLHAGEDDLAATIVPNLNANGAALEHVYVVRTMRDDGRAVQFYPGRHLPDIENHIDDETRLIVIDPALSLVGSGRDEYRANEIRESLEPVVNLARRRRVAVLAITHFLKRHNASGSGVLDRVIGSQAWGAVARMVWAVEDTDAGPTVMRVKSNIGPSAGGYRYTLEPQDMGEGIRGVRLDLGAAVEGDADIEFTRTGGDEREPSKLDGVTEWLREYVNHVQEVPESWEAIKQAGKAAGDYTAKTMRNARDRLKQEGVIVCRRVGFGSEGRFLWGPPC